MKFFVLIFWLLLITALSTPLHATTEGVPKEIAGFRLGEDITDYQEIEYSDYLKNVVIMDWHGFKKGVLSYGICAYPGKIVRITMKYADSTKPFYNKLLKKFKQKYGKPTEWGGDAFGILFKWKWVFLDEQNERVTLILQHNLQDHNENIGTVMKLTYPERIIDEQACFIEQCEINKSQEEKAKLEKRSETNWDYLIPKQ
ncbi:MAG: hypothetical protein D6B25_06630 [Desulfobulbaceae bacterium]|nr:MAG: hypothetical protein D6B25_06630 [Desulfobulbaceae bacterium]